MSSRFDRRDKKLGQLTEKIRETNQRLSGLEHKARQPRLATEADVEPSTKTRKRMEAASAADRVKSGDSSSSRVDDGSTYLTGFVMIAESLLMAPEKCIGDALVDEGAKASKVHLPPVEVRMLSSAAGGLLPAGTPSTVMRTIFSSPLPSWSLGEETKERTGRTNFNQLAPLPWRKVIRAKLRQTLVFDPGKC